MDYNLTLNNTLGLGVAGLWTPVSRLSFSLSANIFLYSGIALGLQLPSTARPTSLTTNTCWFIHHILTILKQCIWYCLQMYCMVETPHNVFFSPSSLEASVMQVWKNKTKTNKTLKIPNRHHSNMTDRPGCVCVRAGTCKVLELVQRGDNRRVPLLKEEQHHDGEGKVGDPGPGDAAGEAVSPGPAAHGEHQASYTWV